MTTTPHALPDAEKLREAIRCSRAALDEHDANPEAYCVRHDLKSDAVEMMRVLLAAAESTLPRTKMVEVWRVEYGQAQSEEGPYFPFSASFHTPFEARAYEEAVRRWRGTGCIRVTGPHLQEVPA